MEVLRFLRIPDLMRKLIAALLSMIILLLPGSMFTAVLK